MKLLHCPFCGKQARKVSNKECFVKHKPGCFMLRYSEGLRTFFHIDELDRWNTRKPLELSDEADASWVCDFCAQKFEYEVDLLAHQFESACDPTRTANP